MRTIWSDLTPSRLNWLQCPAGGFYILQSRISFIIYLEPLKHVLSSCKGFVYRICFLIQNHLKGPGDSFQGRKQFCFVRARASVDDSGVFLKISEVKMSFTILSYRETTTCIMCSFASIYMPSGWLS